MICFDMTNFTDLLMVVVNSANKVTSVAITAVTAVTETDAETLDPGAPTTHLLLLISSNM